MSDYPFRSYSPTKRTQVPPAGSYSGLQSMPGFEGWRAEGDVDRTPSSASTPGIVPEVVPKASPASNNPFLSSPGAPTPSYSSASSYDLPPSLQAGTHGGIRRDSDFDPLAFDTPDASFKRTSYRHVRTPSESSADSASRSRASYTATGSRRRDRTPSRSPSRAIPPRDGIGATQRTPSGNVMGSIFNAQNAAAVGSALGSAASFIGSRAGIIKPDGQAADDADSVPGGFNNRPVPDTVTDNNGFNLGNAVNYLSNLASPPQTPATPPPLPPRQQGGGSPFTLSNALSYLQQATGQQPAAGNNGGLPQNFQLAGIEIDFNWIAQKAGEQNPWVLLGGAVVSFYIISSIIATLIWYSVVAGILYVVYLVGVKNGGFKGIGGTPPRRRVAPGGSGGWSSGAAGRTGGGPEWRRRLRVIVGPAAYANGPGSPSLAPLPLPDRKLALPVQLKSSPPSPGPLTPSPLLLSPQSACSSASHNLQLSSPPHRRGPPNSSRGAYYNRVRFSPRVSRLRPSSSPEENPTLSTCLFQCTQPLSHHDSSSHSSSLRGWKAPGRHRGSCHGGHCCHDSYFDASSSCSSSFAPAVIGDIDCNLQDFLAVDIFAAAAAAAATSTSSSSTSSATAGDFDLGFTGFDLLGGNADAFAGFGTAADEDAATNTSSSQGSSGDLESQLPFDLHSSSTLTAESSFASSAGQDIDLESLFSLQQTHAQSLPLTEYAMGLPLFATPTATMSSASPMQDSSSFSSSPSSNSPSSVRNPPSQLSTPVLSQQGSSYRVQKQKAKPGPKPKLSATAAATISSAFSTTPEDPDSPAVLDKRFRNNIAAKKYRQKKVDRISELEAALSDMTRERDELRLLLARKEAEGQVLREVMARNGNSSALKGTGR
ncbi:hypothetical protein Dda_1505 [Drechslerella dactyloides]|uniref:BZIP domain-containing protein n=1 Tax=Drechslerella dactyloides TaxID=74499 RepID=A0AAD6J6A6_DREDA|nr:hypothetical protein Dda_1505 [Drechslerella dactyloides]